MTDTFASIIIYNQIYKSYILNSNINSAILTIKMIMNFRKDSALILSENSLNVTSKEFITLLDPDLVYPAAEDTTTVARRIPARERVLTTG